MTAAGSPHPPGNPGVGPWPPAHVSPDGAREKLAARRADPLAVALGNATLFGVGYFLQRRRLAAICAAVVSLILLVVIAVVGQPAWLWRVTLVLWWLAMIVHGWLSARRAARPAAPAAAAEAVPLEKPVVRRQRRIAAAAAAVVLVSAVGVAVEARLLEASAANSHRAGDCTEARETLERIGARHRLVDPYVARRTESSREACRLLQASFRNARVLPEEAADLMARYADHPSALWPDASERHLDLLLRAGETELTLSLSDEDTSSLEHGVELLTRVLEMDSGLAGEVNQILNAYVRQLRGADACGATAAIDWIVEHDPLDDLADRVATVAPSILLACGDGLLEDSPYEARDVYRTLLDRYPDADTTEAARDGLDEAEAVLEEDALRSVFRGFGPGYCEEPIPYRRAPAYRGGGPHLVLVDEDVEMPDEHIAPDERTYDTVLNHSLPSEWIAEEVTDATLVLCASSEPGQRLATCPYEGGLTLPLHRQRIHVRAYEIRTAEVAFEVTMEIGNNGCPQVIHYPRLAQPTLLYAPTVPEQVRSALRPRIDP